MISYPVAGDYQQEDLEEKADPRDFVINVDPSVEVSGYDSYNSYKFTQSATITVQYTGIKPFDDPKLDVE